MRKTKRGKALEITPEVREAVYRRDEGLCVFCERPGLPEAHFIPRSKGGLGIEENILTLCRTCHRRFDQGTARERDYMRSYFRNYLKEHYPDWDESKLIYRRFPNVNK